MHFCGVGRVASKKNYKERLAQLIDFTKMTFT